MLHIKDNETREYVGRIVAFSKKMNLGYQLCRQLEYLSHYGQTPEQYLRGEVRCVLYRDFAGHSCVFCMERRQTDGTWRHWFEGGLIYQGPEQPADGSFPSLTVSLHKRTGWFVHT